MKKIQLCILLVLSIRPSWGQGLYEEHALAAKRLLFDLVAANTSNPPGNEARAVEIGARRLREAGIPFEISEFAPGRKNLVARLKGSGRKAPLLLLAHTDVVGAGGQQWNTDPHRVHESNGYLIGRGVVDDLGMACIELETLVLLKKTGVWLERDVILAWTGDEESGGSGIQALLRSSPTAIAAAFAINEGGGLVLTEGGQSKYVALQTAEKIYQDFELVVEGPTGHSSIPMEPNAIARLAKAVDRIASRPFAPRLLPVTRAYFAARSAIETGPLARAMRALAASEKTLPREALELVQADPLLSAQLRTTCVPTLLSGGTRVNALPAEATANINCRILPDETVGSVAKALSEIIDDPGVALRPVKDFSEAAPSPIEGPVFEAIRKVVQKRWPRLPIIPTLSTGATDSRFLRATGIHAYGFNPIGVSESDLRRAHGIDERIREESFAQGLELMHELVLELAGK